MEDDQNARQGVAKQGNKAGATHGQAIIVPRAGESKVENNKITDGHAYQSLRVILVQQTLRI